MGGLGEGFLDREGWGALAVRGLSEVIYLEGGLSCWRRRRRKRSFIMGDWDAL